MPKMTVGAEKSVERRLLLPFLRADRRTTRRGTDQRLRGVEKEIRFSFSAAFFLPFRYISNKIFRDPPNLAH